ncbi:hydrogen peroxide-inducible genes activator [Motiliproteus coralliicola]|uniref:Hydrogen peroxide-inducible genes activator n=1 Tax=Motiliproteus coralliicola TaxID=2283196 RepID=A0A369WEL9_9GAMM|nr:hydrogen peroxide-inducible genes activator [Motiliproteus coralliicola]RDE19609.1 hydrogen peroxide-inducible genes activator [Motiliproteus coralliicola]
MISIKQLSYAVAVEKTLHFKHAAELSHISQSALSTALNELEKQLGLQIFERDNKKVLITPIGHQVLAHAHAILAQVDSLEQLADSQRSPLSFPISIGIIPTICPYLLPRFLPLLNQRHPNAQLNIVEEQSQVLVDQVRSGEIDTAILALPYACDGLLTMEFWQEDFYWVSLKEKQFADRTEITSGELNHCNLMLLKEGHCLKEHALEVCRLPQQIANQGVGATSLNTLIEMVLGQLGTTLVPQMALEQLIGRHQSLSALHLGEPGPHRRIAFILRPNSTRMSSVEALIALCKEALAQSEDDSSGKN